MSEIELLCIGKGSQPTIYFRDDGVWREPSAITATSGLPSTQLRDRLATVLKAVMDAEDPLPPEVEGVGFSLYESLVPDPIRKQLSRVADEAEPGNAPLLKVHVHKIYDWIPWELLHDGKDFLGLRFQVARLPIVPTPPDMSDRTHHPLRRVRSILGADVLQNDAASEIDSWRKTFDGLLPPAAEELRVPPAELVEGPWPTMDIFKECQRDDILHVTCHGTVREGEPRWTFKQNDPQDWRYDITTYTVPTLNLSATRPLVFGNACKSGPSESQLRPGLAILLFEHGAMNVIATLAPISRTLALEFARSFYERLLGTNGNGGTPIAEALWTAKRRFADERGAADPSYLFYCLYGPPDTRFVADGG
jgi:CHAT domain